MSDIVIVALITTIGLVMVAFIQVWGNKINKSVKDLNITIDGRMSELLASKEKEGVSSGNREGRAELEKEQFDRRQENEDRDARKTQ